MKKDRQPLPIGKVVDAMFRKIPAPQNADYLSIYRTWKQTVGDNIARNSRPEGIRAGVLFVGVSNSVWMQELSFLKKKIIEKINENLSGNRIKDIRFKISDFSMQSPEKEPEPLSLTDDEKLMISHAVSVIADDDVRKAFKGVMSSYISGKK